MCIRDSLSPELLEHERQVLAEHVKDMDVIFCSALVPGKIAPVVITLSLIHI